MWLHTLFSFSKTFIPAYVPLTGRPKWILVWHWDAAPSLSKWGGLSWNRTTSGCSSLCPYPQLPLRHKASCGHLQTPLPVRSDTLWCADCWARGSLGAIAIPVRLNVGCSQPETPGLPNSLHAPADIYPAACSESWRQTPLWRGHRKRQLEF